MSENSHGRDPSGPGSCPTGEATEASSSQSDRDPSRVGAINAVAEAWASIDGKMEAFRRERDEGIGYDDPTYTGHYEGYLVEAESLIRRVWRRGFAVVPRPTLEEPVEAGETTEALVARLEAELGVKGINSVFRRALAIAKEASADAKLPKGLLGIVSDDVIRAIDAEAPFYQFREIGEGQDWQFCSKAVFDSFARDPHIDTREVPASEARRPQGIEARSAETSGSAEGESPVAEGDAPAKPEQTDGVEA